MFMPVCLILDKCIQIKPYTVKIQHGDIFYFILSIFNPYITQDSLISSYQEYPNHSQYPKCVELLLLFTPP